MKEALHKVSADIAGLWLTFSYSSGFIESLIFMLFYSTREIKSSISSHVNRNSTALFVIFIQN